jgi:hypothetical protein
MITVRRIASLALFTSHCVAAPLASQAADLFASELGCSAANVTSNPVEERPHYETVAVRGCGYRQVYTCNVDVGCAPVGPTTR